MERHGNVLGLIYNYPEETLSRKNLTEEGRKGCVEECVEKEIMDECFLEGGGGSGSFY